MLGTIVIGLVVSSLWPSPSGRGPRDIVVVNLSDHQVRVSYVQDADNTWHTPVEVSQDLDPGASWTLTAKPDDTLRFQTVEVWDEPEAQVLITQTSGHIDIVPTDDQSIELVTRDR